MSQRDEKDRIIGAIFPVIAQHGTNIFSNKKDIFVKFSPFNLFVGAKIVFYISKEKILIGESTISSIQKMRPESVWPQYGNQLFITKDEYEKYAFFSKIENTKRKMSQITVFQLKKIKSFKRPVIAFFTVTASGRYLTNELYEEIKDEARI